MATSDYGHETQEDLSAIVGYDEKFNNAVVRHSIDLKNQAIFCNLNPINVTFHDMKKFDLVNPVIGKLATQVKASKLTDYQLTKKLLEQGEEQGVVAAMVEEAMMERQIQVHHHQELPNKKWKILLED